VEGPLRNALRLSVGIGVSVACLYFATRGTDWGAVGAAILGASPGWIGAVVLATLASVYIRAQRWRVLLRPLGDVPLYPALSATAIGFGASSVLPFRVGEVVRPALLGRRVGVGMTGALSTVVLERMFDMLSVLVCLIAVLLLHRVPGELRRAAFVLTGVAAVGLVVLVAMQRNRPRAEAVIAWFTSWLPASVDGRARQLAHSFLSCLDGLADLPTIARVVGYSAYLWGVIALTFLFSFLALHIDVPLAVGSLTMLVTVAAAVSLPQAPGAPGTWQFGCVVPLERIFHVPHDAAVGYSLVTWALQMALNVIVGVIFLLREDLSVGQLLRLAPRDTPAAES
jgi:hypothetical protein